jgi:hypothetical protein
LSCLGAAQFEIFYVSGRILLEEFASFAGEVAFNFHFEKLHLLQEEVLEFVYFLLSYVRIFFHFLLESFLILGHPGCFLRCVLLCLFESLFGCLSGSLGVAFEL